MSNSQPLNSMYKLNPFQKLFVKLFFSIPEKVKRTIRIKSIYTYLVAKSCGACGINLLVNDYSKGFHKNVFLSNNVSFNGCRILGTGEIHIGRYFHSGEGLVIITDNHNYDNAEQIPYDRVRISRPVIIKDFVWVGHNVIILPGVTIGEGVIVGAGAVISKDVPDYAVVGGNPALPIKFRNIEQFKKLKEQRKYL